MIWLELLTIIAGSACFGAWQGNVFAGIFMFVFMLIMHEGNKA